MAEGDERTPQLEYRAFISYSRTDRAAAVALHAKLERYVLPNALRLIKPGLRHDARPLKPVFRDETDLVPGQDLPVRIQNGLRKSEYLIVVCSPDAVRSEWVDKEIRDFAGMGRSENILAIVVAGEPNAAARGHDPALECLPTALRYRLAPSTDGTGTRATDQPAEPLWVDWRGDAGKDRTMFLRLVAALLSLDSLDELIRRDARYRRRRAMALWSAAALACAALLAGGVGFGLIKRAEAIERSNTLAELADNAAATGNIESAARYGLLAMKDYDTPLFGFAPKAAERALVSALLGNRRARPATPTTSHAAGYALSADGRMIAVIADNRTILLWDAITGQRAGPDIRMPADIGGMVIAPDNRSLAIAVMAGEGYSVKLWDIASRRVLGAPIEVGEPLIDTLAFAPDGRTLAIVASFADGGGGIDLVDVASGHVRRFANGAEVESKIVFSPDGRLIATGSSYGTQLWDFKTLKAVGERITIGTGGGDASVTAAFSPDSKTLAIASSEGSVQLWDIARKERASNAFFAGGVVDSVAFSPDGKLLGEMTRDGVVLVSDLDGQQEQIGIALQPAGELFAFTPDSRHVVTLSPSEFRLWDLAPALRSETRNVFRGEKGIINAAEFSPDGKSLAYENMFTGKVSFVGPACGTKDGTDLEFKGDRRGFQTEEEVRYSADGRFLAHRSPYGVWVVSCRTSEQWRIASNGGTAREDGAIALSRDGQLIASINSETDRTAMFVSFLDLWDTGLHRHLGRPTNLHRVVTFAEFAPDGKTLALASAQNALQFRNVATRTPFTATIGGSRPIAYSPDGHILAVAGSAGSQGAPSATFRVLEADSGNQIGSTLTGHRNDLERLLISTDDQFAVSASRTTLRVWDLATNRQIGPPLDPLLPSTGWIEAIALLPGGSRIAALTRDGDLTVFNVDRLLHLRGAALIAAVCAETVPGKLSRLLPEDFRRAPGFTLDADACGRKAG